jgi:hypothetical protein
MSAEWVEASKSFKCPHCESDHWCSYNVRNKGWVCMRSSGGKPTKNGGSWFPEGENNRPKFIPKPKPEKPHIDAAALMNTFRRDTNTQDVALLAHNLGVSLQSLIDVGVAWARPHSAWAFPMFAGTGQCVGIRLRLRDERKISVCGGREGLFLPRIRPAHTAYIVEGPTDLSAALTLGLWGIGRPSCRGGIAHTQVAINRLGIRRCILIGDNDLSKWENQESPGIDGAKHLAHELQVPVATMLLPTKDLRQFVNDGGTAALLGAMEEQLVWRQPR